jgi:sugar phosphate isomerase/epimerase
MNFGMSTRCFPSALTRQNLDRLLESEFTLIELHATPPAFDYHDRAFVRSIAGWFQDKPLPRATLHLPFEEDLGQGRKRTLPLLHAEKRLREQVMDEMKRSLEIVERLAVAHVVLHLGASGESFSPAKLDLSYSAIAMMQAFAGVHILLETLPNDIATPNRLREFLSVAQVADAGICYDTGHGRLQEPKPGLDLNSVEAIHLNDNDGDADEHLLPFDGSIEWPAFAEALTLSKFAGPLILETDNADVDKAVECRSRMTDLLQEAANSIEEFRLKYKLPPPREMGRGGTGQE